MKVGTIAVQFVAIWTLQPPCTAKATCTKQQFKNKDSFWVSKFISQSHINQLSMTLLGYHVNLRQGQTQIRLGSDKNGNFQKMQWIQKKRQFHWKQKKESLFQKIRYERPRSSCSAGPSQRNSKYFLFFCLNNRAFLGKSELFCLFFASEHLHKAPENRHVDDDRNFLCRLEPFWLPR